MNAKKRTPGSGGIKHTFTGVVLSLRKNELPSAVGQRISVAFCTNYLGMSRWAFRKMSVISVLHEPTVFVFLFAARFCGRNWANSMKPPVW